MRLPIIDANERPDLCAPCGGKCCEIWPGIPHPEDLGAPDLDTLRASVSALLRSGRWVVDHDASSWLDREPSAWYLRPAIRGTEGNQPPDFEFDRSGPCTFLVDGRCEIYEHRPRGCRLVVPSSRLPDGCKTPVGKIAQVDPWEPYESMLLALRNECE